MARTQTLCADRYRLLRQLGSGGMATVWAAEDERLGRTVALKRLHVPTGDGSARFRREARIGASLRHQNLVTVLDVVEDGPTVLLVMEHVDGESLAERLERGPLAPDEALPVLRQVAAALDHAHEKGVVHRDVKPANILLGGSGRVKLADLGIARALGATNVTERGAIIGSPAYLSPEQASGLVATRASDVYALAAVAFEALSGRAAWFGRRPVDVLEKIRTEPPPDLREAWPEAPETAAAVLRRGLAPKPAMRPRTAGALVDELGTALGGRARQRTRRFARLDPRPPTVVTATAAHPAAAAARPAPDRRRLRRSVLAPALLALATVGVAAALLTGRGEEPEPVRSAFAPPRLELPATVPALQPRSTPRSAVRGFYERAAAGDFAAAWRLAGPQMRAAFGSQAELARQLGTLRSVTFEQLDVAARDGDSATVAVRTVARHETYTDRCSGTLLTSRSAGRWRVDPGSIDCRQ